MKILNEEIIYKKCELSVMYKRSPLLQNRVKSFIKMMEINNNPAKTEQDCNGMFSCSVKIFDENKEQYMLGIKYGTDDKGITVSKVVFYKI